MTQTETCESILPQDLLEVSHIAKVFGGQTAVADVSLSVGSGEVVGLVGPNGAGKSTTFRIICGLLRPTKGVVRVSGQDVQRNPGAVRSLIGVLIDSPGYYPGLSAFDHLAYLARARGCFSRDLVLATLAEVGLAPESRKRVGQFSLGMKQRLGIAMAILHAPRLLVLDEPMNGLDPLGMASLRTFVRNLAARRDVGLLVSSHLLHEIEQICDRILFIREGRLLETAWTCDALQQTETVLVHTDDDLRARELLRREAFVREVVELPAGLECRTAAEDVPRLVALLVGAGIGVRQITPRGRSLEDMYVTQYGGAATGGIA